MRPPEPGEEEEPEEIYHHPDYIVVLEGMDYDFYLAQFPPKTWIADPAAHYLQEGWESGYDPHPEFSTTFYLEYNADVRESGINPFVHYLNYGRAEGRNAGPWTATEHYALVRAHLDAGYYLAQLRPKVREAVKDPVEHFMAFGWHRGLDPHPDFKTRFYLRRYPDVRNTGRNPYVHYLMFGLTEGRVASPVQNDTVEPAPAKADSPESGE